MEKLITIHPYESEYKEMFEHFNSVLFHLSQYDDQWREYKEKYRFDPTHFGRGGDFPHQMWKDMYQNVPKEIELWTISGTDFGIDEAIPYMDFLKILKGRKFTTAPFGTGLWLPEEFAKQNIQVEDNLWVFSPIEPYGGPWYKSVQIVLKRSTDFDGAYKIRATLEQLRPTETWVDPSVCRVVQRILD